MTLTSCRDDEGLFRLPLRLKVLMGPLLWSLSHLLWLADGDRAGQILGFKLTMLISLFTL